MEYSSKKRTLKKGNDRNQQLLADKIPESRTFAPPPFQLFSSSAEELEEGIGEVVQAKEIGSSNHDVPEPPSDNPSEGDAPPNNTGLPDQLKTNIESMSGEDLSDVKVHYNSSEPMQLQAHAFAQGTDIHLGPGQEKHLGHEAWHVVQQKKGQVKPTLQLKQVNINDDAELEREADQMGAKAMQGRLTPSEPVQMKTQNKGQSQSHQPIVQRVLNPKDKAKDDNDKKSLDYIDSESTADLTDFVLLRILEMANSRMREKLDEKKISGLKKEIEEKKNEKFNIKDKFQLAVVGNLHHKISMQGKMGKDKGTNKLSFKGKEYELPNITSLENPDVSTSVHMKTPFNLFSLSGGNYNQKTGDLDPNTIVPQYASETARSSIFNLAFNSMHSKVMSKEDEDIEDDFKAKMDDFKKSEDVKMKEPRRKKNKFKEKKLKDVHPMGGGKGQISGILNNPLLNLEDYMGVNPSSYKKEYNDEFKSKKKSKGKTKKKAVKRKLDNLMESIPESKRVRFNRSVSLPDLSPKNQREGNLGRKRYNNTREKYLKLFGDDGDVPMDFLEESSKSKMKDVSNKKEKERRFSTLGPKEKDEIWSQTHRRRAMKSTFDDLGLSGGFSPNYEYDPELSDLVDLDEDTFGKMDNQMQGTSLAFLHPVMKDTHDDFLESQSIDKTVVKLMEEQKMLHYLYGLQATESSQKKFDTTRVSLNSDLLYSQYKNNKDEDDFATPFNPNFGSYEQPVKKHDTSSKESRNKLSEKMKGVVNPKSKSSLDAPDLDQLSGTMHIAESMRNPHMVPLNALFFEWAMKDGMPGFKKDIDDKNKKKSKEKKSVKVKELSDKEFYEYLIPEYAPMAFGLSQGAAREIRQRINDEWEPDKMGGDSLEDIFKRLYNEKADDWDSVDSGLRTKESRKNKNLDKGHSVMELMLREVILLRSWLNSLVPVMKPKGGKFTEKLIEELVAGMAFEYYDVEEEVLTRALAAHDANLQLIPIDKDGDCLYQSVRHQLGLVGKVVSADELRNRIVTLLTNNAMYFNGFINGRDLNVVANEILTSRSWNNQGGDLAAQLMASIIGQNITVVTPNGVETRQPNTDLNTAGALIPGVLNAIVIAYNGYGHYWSTQPKVIGGLL